MNVDPTAHNNHPHRPYGAGALLAFTIGAIVTIVIVVRTGSVDGAVAVLVLLLLILGVTATDAVIGARRRSPK